MSWVRGSGFRGQGSGGRGKGDREQGTGDRGQGTGDRKDCIDCHLHPVPCLLASRGSSIRGRGVARLRNGVTFLLVAGLVSCWREWGRNYFLKICFWPIDMSGRAQERVV